jgi:chromosome segregation protein
MRLNSLEAIGFKSFVDRLHLSFPGGITTIVGPNGCGKSNIVDAMLWAIGERSPKHLRGKSMEDVIFGGTEGRRPMGMAEVSLTFSNEDGSAPEAYREFSEITITRRLYRSGESEYLLNKVPCRLRDITDLFLDSGIGVNGYSVVEQGRVERLIHANPQDRRFLIEEAAGIAKYKERKRLALMKMEATQQNLVRIQDIISEVKRQTVSLERQVKRAEEYKTIRKEMKEIEIQFALQEYGDLLEKGEASKGYLKALQQREAETSAHAAKEEAFIEGMKIEAMEEEERFRSLQQEVFDFGRNIQKTESELEFFRKDSSNLQKQEGEHLLEIRELLQTWRKARRERMEVERLWGETRGEHERNSAMLAELEAVFNELKGRYQALEAELEEEQAALIDSLTRLTSFRNRLLHLEERTEDHRKRARYHDEEADQVRLRVARLEQDFSAVRERGEETRSAHGALHEEKARWEEEMDTLREVLCDRQAQRVEAEEVVRQDRSRHQSLQELQESFEGYEKGVKSILLRKKEEEEKWQGVLGTVADILEPEPRYEAPLEAVLGERLQFLIVEGEREGTEAIRFLKQESAGRGSFIVRGLHEKGDGTERACPACEAEKGESGQNGSPLPLSRYVNVKPGFAPIAEFLFGGVGVVNHWDDAVQWMRGNGAFHTVVTLDGDVFERPGILSGGRQDQGLTILERKRAIRDLRERVLLAEEKCLRAQEEEKGLQGEISRKELLLEERRREIQGKEIELLHHERDLEGVKKELSHFQQRMEVLQFEGTELEAEVRELEEEKKAVSLRAEQEEEKKREREESVRLLKVKTSEAREETERVGSGMTQKKVISASLEEKLRAAEARRVQLSETNRAVRDQVLKRVKAIKTCRHEAVILRQRIEQGETDLGKNLQGLRAREGVVAAQKEKVDVLSTRWKEAEASSRYLRQELDQVRQKMHEEEIRSAEVDLRLRHLQDTVKERYGTNLAPLIGKQLSDIQKEEMAKRLTELKSTMEGFGEVNLMAVEEYQELRQRHDFLTEQQSDLQQALESLKKAITRINRTTTKRFQETFHLVNEKFKEIFLRLFRGGQASLMMVDEQDPSTTGVDIMAQPPGKKLQNIDLLSGGEKALVATALLFGLLMIKPTPFCLLDEVDAPLDDANINRFIELVKEFSKTSQFVMITHNKKTMETANTLYGVTMETPGVSKIVSVRLN